MKVVSWNIKRRSIAWDYLVEEIGPDVAFLQESPAQRNGVMPPSLSQIWI